MWSFGRGSTQGPGTFTRNMRRALRTVLWDNVHRCVVETVRVGDAGGSDLNGHDLTGREPTLFSGGSGRMSLVRIVVQADGGEEDHISLRARESEGTFCMDSVAGLTSKFDRTWRLIALGRRFLLEVDTEEIDVAELTRFVTTWRSAFDEPMSATSERVDELAAMIATARPQPRS